MLKMIPFALAFVLLIASNSWAEVYKWTDSDGKIHYGSAPPTESHSSVTPMTDLGGNQSGASNRSEKMREAGNIPNVPPKNGQHTSSPDARCKLALKNLDAGIEDYVSMAKMNYQLGRITKANYDDGVRGLKDGQSEFRSEMPRCATRYKNDKAWRSMVDCIADLIDPIGLVNCNDGK